MGSIAPWSYDQVLAYFNSKLRKRYTDALDSLRTEPLSKRDARVSAFVKSEKFDPEAKVNPDPRMIQSRHPRYGVEVARYLKPIEKRLYHMKGPTKLRIIAKGLNQRQRAVLLQDKLALFDDPVIGSLDASRWDMHVAESMLKIEHQLYLACINDDFFRRLLKWQLKNKVRTSNGLKYTVRGRRMSGDFNTALGNCALMVMMVRAAMKRLGVRKWDILDDGDDCLCIMEAGDWERVSPLLPGVFLDYGQELKIENVARHITEVVFCQSRVVELPDGPVFVRNWRKVLSQTACGVKHWSDPSYGQADA